LRLREGSASKSRLRGQSDKAFMTLNRAGIALFEPHRSRHMCASPLMAEIISDWRVRLMDSPCSC
jgi:hypothetical protein